jgi:hypothetical protein
MTSLLGSDMMVMRFVKLNFYNASLYYKEFVMFR